MTIKELYEAIACKPDLHSIPQVYDNILVWKLYKNAYVQASYDDGDISVEIIGDSVFSGTITHWHSDEEDIIDELYSLGKKGNMLVLKKSLLGTSIFYTGPSENFPLTERTSFHFGRKKWDGGQLIYLEQK